MIIYSGICLYNYKLMEGIQTRVVDNHCVILFMIIGQLPTRGGTSPTERATVASPSSGELKLQRPKAPNYLAKGLECD